MKRWAGWIVIGVLALTLGALLLIDPWSAGIPPASAYSSPWDLARDLNDHGLGCSNPTRRPSSLFSRRIGLPEPLVCSVGGRPVVLDVIPSEFLAAWVRAFSPGIHYTNLQDLADAFGGRGAEGLRRSGIDATLVGPNWVVETRSGRDSLSVLSAIRTEIGGTLLVASSTTPSSSPTSDGS
jgi:hypothetical protein